MFAPPSPAAAPGSRRWWRSQRPAAACRSGVQQGAARLSAAWTCGSGWVVLKPQEFLEARTAGRPLLGKAGGAFHRREGAKYTAAARTSPLGPRWRGPRRRRISLGDNGQGQWEAEQTPA